MARLEVGKVESRKVLEVEADLFEAKNSLADALVQYQRALLETDLIRGSVLKARNLDLTQKELELRTASLLANAQITDSQHERLMKEQEADAQAKTPSPPGPAPETPSARPPQSSAESQAPPATITNIQAAAVPVPQPALPPVVPAASPAGKTERLMELLDAYKQSLLTPAEYHQRRAKILAEP